MTVPPEPQIQDAEYWRAKILRTILVAGAVIAPPVFIPMILMALHHGLWILILLNTAAYGIVLFLLLSREMAYRIRAGCTLVLTFAVGAYLIFYFGMLSGGPVCLFAFAVLAGLLMGTRATIGALIVNGVVLLLFGWLAATGRWAQDMPFFPTPLRGIVAWGTYMIVNIATALSAAVMIRGIDNLANKERSANQKLRDEHAKLKEEIARRVKAQNDRHESEKRYRLLAENASDIIWTLDLETMRFTYVSPSIEKIRGLTPEEGLTERLDEAISPASLENLTRILTEELARDAKAGVDPKRSRTVEFELRKRDGSYAWAEATVTILRDQGGRPVELMGVTRDISQRKRAHAEKMALEAKLQQMQKLETIATLAGGIAHQFNNGLATIVGRLDLLREDLPPETFEENLAPIEQTALHMSDLTKQLLAYAREGKYLARPIDLSRFVIQTLPLIQHTLPPAVETTLELPPGLPLVEADVTQLQMVLSTLLANASEAIDDRGRIHIACTEITIDRALADSTPALQPGPYLKLSVKDNGQGMDAETCKRIFEPFFTTKFQGRGLGLAAAYGIVRNHDGWISVTSEPGEGTLVDVYLPVSQAENRRRTAADQGQTRFQEASGTILLIEDEPMVMEMGCAMLEKLGYQVITASSGSQAVDVGKHFDGSIDVALLDLILPDMEAKQVYTDLKAARPSLSVIVCSGYSVEGPAQEILDAGADDFMQKPFSMQTLSAKIKAAALKG